MQENLRLNQKKSLELESEDIPDWLNDIAEEKVIEESKGPESAISEFPDFEDADAALAWMESLAVKQGVSEDELLTSPEERTESPPTWVQEISSTEAESATEIETPFVEEILDEGEMDEIPDWLSEPIQMDDTETPSGILEEEAPVLDLPEIEQENAIIEAEESEIEVTETLDSVSDTEFGGIEKISIGEDIVAPDFDDADAAMAWLEGLAAKQGVSEDELLTRPEERSETPPEWVQDTIKQETTEFISEEPVVEIEEEIPSDVADIPGWILEPQEPEKPAPGAKTATSDIERVELPSIQDEQSPLEETLPEEVDIPDWILDTPETEDLTVEPEEDLDILDELHETVEVSTSEFDEALTEDAGAVPDFEDADAAMAWLESLAAKQGVSEDELLTSPEERSETPPSWVQDAVEAEKIPEEADETETEDVSLEAENLSDWIAKVPDPIDSDEKLAATGVIDSSSEISDTSTEAADAEIDFDDPDAAMAWLESLAAKQGVSEEELLTSPDERSETPPSWVQDAVETENKEIDEIPGLEAETQTEVPAPPESQISEPIADEAQIPLVDEGATLAPPSWISGGEIPEDEDFSWIQSAVSEEADQLLDLNQASLIQLERLPGVGFRRAQSITAYRDEHGNFTSFDDLRYVPGMDSDTLNLLKARAYIETPEIGPQAEFLEEPVLFESQEADDAAHEQQIAAQSKLNQGEISEAMAAYGELIQNGQRLEGIIEDLKFATEKFPEDLTLCKPWGMLTCSQIS